jgi:outer membrane protein
VKLLRTAALLLILVISQISFAQPVEKWSLEKCIDYALNNNLVVRQAGVAARVAQNDNLQSKLNLLPSVDASASYNLNFGNSLNPVTFQFVESNSQSASVNLQASLPLFTGLQQIHNIQRTKYDLMASQFDYAAAQNNVALSVSSAFLQILLNREIIGVLEKQQQLTTAQHESISSRVKTGQLSENSLYEVEAQLARDEANIVSAKGIYDVSVLTLKQLLQLKNDQGFDLDIPEIDADAYPAIGSESSSAIFDYAVGIQPSIKSAEARVKSADVATKIVKGTFSPTLAAFTALSSGYFSQDQRATRYDSLVTPYGTISIPSDYQKVPFNDQFKNNFRKVVGLQLSVPIFGKLQRFTNLGNAKLQIQLRQLQLEAAKNSLRQDIEQAYANAKAAGETYQANKKSYAAAKKALESLDKRYRGGLATDFELQQSKNTLASAESEIAKAKYTYVFRLKVLDFYQGKKITLNP